MKIYIVVTDRDGATIKKPGEIKTEIIRSEYRYAAETIQQVWDAIAFIRNDEEQTLVAIIEEHKAITVLNGSGLTPSHSILSKNSDCRPSLSKAFTLKLLKQSTSALHANEVAAFYEKYDGLGNSASTISKSIRIHLKELEAENLIYQTNPGAQRSIRYAPVKKETE